MTLNAAAALHMQPSGTSIANDPEDAKGKVLPFGPAIRKGQMFLRII